MFLIDKFSKLANKIISKKKKNKVIIVPLGLDKSFVTFKISEIEPNTKFTKP